MFYAWPLKPFQRETLFNETINYVTAPASAKIISPEGHVSEAFFPKNCAVKLIGVHKDFIGS